MKQTIMTVLLASLMFAGCEPKSAEERGSISTDVINVPATASQEAKPGSSAQITFKEEKHDFGKITQGEKVSHSFVFTNTGGSDLVISTAQGSCGCTVPSYPKTAIKPNETAQIDVVFDSANKSGLVSKTITLVTNCNPSTKVLTISATIEVPDDK
jgi:hypothetical protein